MAKDARESSAPADGTPVGAIALETELAACAMRPVDVVPFGGSTIEVRAGTDSLWLFIAGHLALRAGWGPGGGVTARRDGAGRYSVRTSLGLFSVALAPEPADRLVRVTTIFTPRRDLVVSDWPRDLYPLGWNGRPLSADGRVEAAQRGLNTGFMFFGLQGFGTVMYLQNLTALNNWHQVAGGAPEGVVGGEWPELGYRPKPAGNPLPKDIPIVASDVLVTWEPQIGGETTGEARLFLELLARLYRRIDKPDTGFRDWAGRSQTTLRHLSRSPKAHVRCYGHLYLHPYTASEYPDCMVQLSVAQSLDEYGRWRGRPVPLQPKLLAGMRKFYDGKLRTLRRYLPNVGDDKNADEVDSWYLYHPLLNLGRLAMAGDEASRALFLDSISFAIRAARRFHYDWPVKFHLRTLEVLQRERTPGGPGQSDVGGIYAFVMLLARDLTGEARFEQEALKAVEAMEGWRFELMYQANLSAWGAAACVRLWRERGDDRFLQMAQSLLAGIFHNSLIWESEIGLAQTFPNFLGITCLSDAPYMAMYECFETFDAFEDILARGGEALPEPVQLLLTEYRKHCLNRTWFYFPDAWPREAMPSEAEVRNGHIDPSLSFPVEDLYADGQKPGQVGQEIYGCGAPFTFVTRAFHDPKGAPFRLFAEYPVRDLRCGRGELTFRLFGAPQSKAQVRLLPRRGSLPDVRVGDRSPGRDADGGTTFTAAAGETVRVRWEPGGEQPL